MTTSSVLIVGYGTYIDSVNAINTPYYILRNSWGTDWGNGGYMYVTYDESELNDGVLGILQAPTYFTAVNSNV